MRNEHGIKAEAYAIAALHVSTVKPSLGRMVRELCSIQDFLDCILKRKKKRSKKTWRSLEVGSTGDFCPRIRNGWYSHPGLMIEYSIASQKSRKGTVTSGYLGLPGDDSIPMVSSE